MKGIRELKARIKGVTSIQKITRAMEMVASTKLRRLQDRALATRPFADRIEAMMKRVAEHADTTTAELLQPKDEVKQEAVFVVGADKGLCGAYNSNLFRAATAYLKRLQEEGVTPQLFIVGRRAHMFFKKIPGLEIAQVFDVPMEKIDYTFVRKALQILVDGFLDDEYQRVSVISTRMKTMASFVPQTQDLLPVSTELGDGDEEADEAKGASDSSDIDYILEPSPQVLLERLLPRYLEMQLYAAILDALASEFAARRMAMKNATDAADDMLDVLGMEYNKARQEGITGELLDIIGGVVSSEG